MSKNTDILDEYGFDYKSGYVRFRRAEMLSAFQFHVREIREVQIHSGLATRTSDNEQIPVIRVHIDLIGGGTCNSGPMHPELDAEEAGQLAYAFLRLRDDACGLDEVSYEIKAVKTEFYPKVYVNWNLPVTPAE